jgi:hypothetical protein
LIQDQKEGEGLYKLPNGEMYIGQFKSNQRSGFGQYIFANGDRFTGYFENDLATKGLLKKADGSPSLNYRQNEEGDWIPN